MRCALVLLYLILSTVMVNAANCFWIGGTGFTNDPTHWASSSGGTASTCAASGGIPSTSFDNATFDASSGGGTVTVNNSSPWSLSSITMGAFTGIWDNSVNNVNMTLAQAGNAFNASGGGTRTIKVGTAIYTLASTTNNLGVAVNFQNSTGMTFTGGSETWVFSGITSLTREFISSQHHGAITVNANCGGLLIAAGNNGDATFTTLTLNNGTSLILSTSVSLVLTSIIANGSSSTKQAFIGSNTQGQQQTISIASGVNTLTWTGIKDTIFTGGATFNCNNCFDLYDNTGITITTPAGGNSGGGSNAIGQQGFK